MEWFVQLKQKYNKDEKTSSYFTSCLPWFRENNTQQQKAGNLSERIL